MITAMDLLLAVPVNRVRVQGVLELQQGAIARSRLHSRLSRKHGGGGHGGQGGLLHQLHPHHHDHYGGGGHGGQGGLHKQLNDLHSILLLLLIRGHGGQDGQQQAHHNPHLILHDKPLLNIIYGSITTKQP